MSKTISVCSSGDMQFHRLRPCSHLSRFAFRSRSSPVPLVRVAFTPGKIDWNGSGFGPVTRSHLFRNATGTSSPVNTPHLTPTPANQVFRSDVKVITCALSSNMDASLVVFCLEYTWINRIAPSHDLNAILFPPNSQSTMRCIAV